MSADDPDLWLTVLTALSVLGGGLMCWAWWSLRRATVQREEWDSLQRDLPRDLGTRLDEIRQRDRTQDDRIATLEGQMAHVPGRDEIHALQVSMASLKGTLDGFQHQVDGLKTLVDRVDQQTKVIDGYLRDKDAAR